jgi:muconate cycloisomerase
LFATCGNLGGRRFGATVLAGLDMALWDIAGKAAGRPVHVLLGGAVRDAVSYFGFPQGDAPGQIARDAKRWADSGCDVIYVKIGREPRLDYEIVKEVRAAIGAHRLRLDANEAWDVLTARSMIRLLSEFDIEFIEQPTSSGSISAFKRVRSRSPIPLAADQLVYSPGDVFEVCRDGAADLIVLGLHEAGGFMRFLSCAAIAEAAGVNICLHGLYETGVTTCATLNAGAVTPNLDDGNQIMNHLLVEDLVRAPALSLQKGRLPLLTGPGLGFELDWDAVERAKERHRAHGSRRRRH